MNIWFLFFVAGLITVSLLSLIIFEVVQLVRFKLPKEVTEIYAQQILFHIVLMFFSFGFTFYLLFVARNKSSGGGGGDKFWY